jgi:ribonuclease HI
LEEVKIYINAYHTGHLKKGIGTYTVVLEHHSEQKGDQILKLIDGYKGTTKNRIALLTCIAALKRMIRPCKIELTINSEYVSRAINNDDWMAWLETGRNAKGKPAANLDLWQQVYDLAMIHEVEFVFRDKNTYTDYMMSEMKKSKIVFKEDTGNV